MKQITLIILVCLVLCGCRHETQKPAQNTIELSRSGFGNIFMSEAYLNASIGRFENNIHFFNNKNSKSVWFDSAAICFLADFIREPANASRYDGYRIFLIQYDRMNPEGQRVAGQFHPNQTSIAICPTINHISDRGAFPEYYKQFIKLRPQTIFGALNHGELCPQQCE